MADERQPASEDAGRRRLIEHDRERDVGERRREYEDGEWQDADDPLGRARQQAVEANSTPGGDRPGMTPRDEAWQREKQVTGQDADEPGLPRTRKGDEGQARQS